MTKYIEQPHENFTIYSDVPSEKNGKIEHALTTKSGQGHAHYKNGDYDHVVNRTSKEVCGQNITDEQTPAKVIVAKNGDIHIECFNGDIVFKAKNIRFEANDGSGAEISISSNSKVVINTPTFTAQSTNATINASGTVLSTGTHVVNYGHASCEATDGPSHDASSLLGKILHIVEQVKTFFASICSDEKK